MYYLSTLQGGAIFLSQSIISIATGGNLTIVNNTANDNFKVGALYVDPGVTRTMAMLVWICLADSCKLSMITI